MISKYITANQQFHSVGQGLFYSLNLDFSSDYDEFNFIYDCGTLSVRKYLDEQIIDFHRYYNVIDLLVISHFDEDHVNGIPDLISGLKVKKLVIPYVDWKERLAIAITLTEKDHEEYISMLRDPVVFFAAERFDVDEILIVGGPDGGRLGDQERPRPMSPKLIRLKPEIHGPLEATVYGRKSDSATSSTMNFALQPSLYPMERLKFYPDGLKVVAGTFWEFEMYTQESADAAKIKTLEKSLITYMATNIISKLQLFDDKHREGVRRIYRSVYTNLNQTSIVLYHGAMLEHQVVQYSHLYDPESAKWNKTEVLSNEKTGTLLTGDLKMSSEKSLHKLTSHFNEFLPLVSVFSLPHHGAAANWNFSHPNKLEKFDLYVSSARLNSRNHPSKQVIKDVLINCGGDVCLVNEVDEFALETTLKIA